MCGKDEMNYMNRDPNMDKEKDIALFVAFCVEEYAAAKGVCGTAVCDLFTKYGITGYLIECFGPLHTQGRDWLIEEIDALIGKRKKAEDA